MDRIERCPICRAAWRRLRSGAGVILTCPEADQHPGHEALRASLARWEAAGSRASPKEEIASEAQRQRPRQAG